MRMLTRRWLVVLAGALVAFSLAACGGDGDAGGSGQSDAAAPQEDISLPEEDVVSADTTDAGAEDAAPTDAGGDTGPVGPAVYEVAFAPAQVEAGTGRISLQARKGHGDADLVVELHADSFDDVLGWAFDLRYPADALQLEVVQFDDVLSGADWDGACAARPMGPGTLNVGCARFVRNPDFSGQASSGGPLQDEQRFASLRFTILRAGELSLEFDPARRAARGGDRSSIAPAWQGGTVTVTRQGAQGGAR